MVVAIDVIHVYKYPLELVAHTHFNKYPTEKEKFVRKVNVLEERTEPHGVKYRKSVAVCENVVPRILRTIGILNEKAILLEEESWLNFKKKQLDVTSRNLTWCKYARLAETSVFKAHKDNPKWTVFEQHGTVDIHGIGPLGRVIELFAQSFLSIGSQRSLSIMESLLEERSKRSFVQRQLM